MSDKTLEELANDASYRFINEAHVSMSQLTLINLQLIIGDAIQSAVGQQDANHKRLVRELDVLLNGDKAAAQASLCDIVAQVRKYSEKLRAVLEDHP